MGQYSVECIAAALIREYLSRKGFKETLEVLDMESPSNSNAITNRMDLMKALRLQSYMKRNKDSENPYKTMVEVMTKHFTERVKLKSDSVEEFETTLPPIPRKSSATGRRSSSSGRINTDLQPMGTKHGDLIIDDDIEGETLVGDGKGGLFDKQEQEVHYVTGMMPQTKKPPARLRGLSGPISSNLDEKDRPRQMKYGRPLSWQKASNDHPTKENRGTDSNSSKSVSTGPVSSTRYRQSNFSTAGGLLNNSDTDPLKTSSSNFPTSARNSIKEVLDIEKEAGERKNNNSLSRFHSKESSIEGPENCLYSVSQSSIAQEEVTSRSYSRSSQNSGIERSPNMVKRVQTPVKKAFKLKSENGTEETQRDYSEQLSDTEFTGEIDPPSTVIKNFTSTIKSTPIDINTAKELKLLIFGSLNLNFPEEWKYQGFTFSDTKRLQFGIIQQKGGPCGVLASVQAVFLQELLFTNQRKASPAVLQPSAEKRTACLCRALAKILWRAGDGNQAVVTVPTGRPQFPLTSQFKGDNLTETLLLYSFDNYKDLLLFLQQNVAQFELHGNNGAIHSLFSVILSRTVSRVKQDMDDLSNKLLSGHFYCNQELVNLYLTGKAVSNVFNDTMELDSGGKQPTILRGLGSRNDIGYLSLFEHHKTCQVGTYYKTPVFPIWVVSSESHFSVLFCLNRDLMNNWRAERRFDLYYYDGLANQETEIRLTIDTTSKFYQPPKDDEMVPPLDLCIRTKWDGAEIDWNGTEPLL